ncbi:MAG: class I SAM-dependent methyltransferase [Thalassobaculum sp.]|uniref:SAM-dependent methyltransferase n=1 Tax=Thalassobaculum sp. TaxID=2022740 RepID=UPI0032EF798A
MSGGAIIATAAADRGTPPRPTGPSAAAPGTIPDGGPNGAPLEHAGRVAAAYLASADPLPAGAVHDIGDGDFRAIGAEFLRHFVTLGGLAPGDDVLDIGCGFGRMALPLARFLAPQARYLGFDIVPEPVEWCRTHVAPLHPGFGFEHLDLRHPLYNPAGSLPADAGFLGRIPAPLGWRPSFVAAVSVFTHLESAAMTRLLAEARAVLRPGGRVFLTAFLTGDGTPPADAATRFPAAAWCREGPLLALQGAPATAAVGVPWDWLGEVMAGVGLRPERVAFGHWRGAGELGGPFGGALGGAAGDRPFQDVVVAR